MSLKSLASIISAVALAIGSLSLPALAQPLTLSSGGFDYQVQQDGSALIVHCTGWQKSSTPACPATSYVIPASIDSKPVTTIADDSFAFGGLTSVTLPASLITVGKRAFAGNLIQNLVLPNSLQRIDDRAFDMVAYSDRAMSRSKPVLTVPESVNFVGFRGLPKVYTIKFLGAAPKSDSVDILDNDSNNISLLPTKISAFYTKGGWTANGAWGHYFGLNVELQPQPGTKVFKDLDYAVTPDGTVTIQHCHQYDLRNCMSPYISIPAKIDGKTVTKIGADAFNGMNVMTLSMPSTITSIGDQAFMDDCVGNIALPAKLQSIGDSAFSCDPRGQGPQIRHIVKIPAGLTFMGKDAFAGFGSKLELHFLGNAPATSAPNIFESNVPYRIFALAAKSGWSSHSFSGQPVVLDTDAPGVQTYGTQNGLDWQLQLDGTVQIVGCSGWNAYTDNSAGKFSCPKRDYVIPETIGGKVVASIAPHAFESSSLKSVNLPSGITSVGEYAFAYGLLDGGDFTYLKSLDLPSKLKSLGNFALSGLVVQNEVNIPATVSTIGVASLPIAREINFLGDAPAVGADASVKWNSPFSFSRFYAADAPEQGTEYITALAAKQGWQNRTFADKHIVLDTDPRPAKPTVTWAVIKETCPQPQTRIVVAVTAASSVSYQLKVTKALSSYTDVYFGDPATNHLPLNPCLPLSKFKAPAGSTYFYAKWAPALSFAVVPISDLGARGPEYVIDTKGVKSVSTGIYGGN